jgi:hypothetical protein
LKSIFDKSLFHFKSIPLKFSAFSAQESYEKFGGWLARLSSETTRAFGGKEVSMSAVPKIAPLNFRHPWISCVHQ